MELTRVGIVPGRTVDPGEAAELLRRDGAAIVTGIGGDESGARRAAQEIFGDRVLAIPDAARVFEGGEKDRRPARVDHTTRSAAHTDGYAYGDCYPDHFLLACSHPCDAGGESFLLDGYALLEELAGDPELSDVPERLATRPIDQTEQGMRPSVSPVVQRSPGGRVMLRRTIDQRPSTGSDDAAADAEMLAVWAEVIRDATEVAPRFKLEAGDAVVIDNYRMLHGREPYRDLRRLMWRVWVWTDDCFGVPDGLLHSDSRYAWAKG